MLFVVNYFAEAFILTVDAFNRLDIVINNAGFMNDRLWELEVDVNVVSSVLHTPKYPIIETYPKDLKTRVSSYFFPRKNALFPFRMARFAARCWLIVSWARTAGVKAGLSSTRRPRASCAHKWPRQSTPPQTTRL